jgi:hypothetical protein
MAPLSDTCYLFLCREKENDNYAPLIEIANIENDEAGKKFHDSYEKK